MGYDLVDDYFDYIVPSFMDLYNIDLLDKKQDPPYPKFLLLLGGLHDTSLNKIIEQEKLIIARVTQDGVTWY